MRYVTQLYLLFLLLSTQTLSAKEISASQARSAAIAFLHQHNTDPLRSLTPPDLTLVTGVFGPASSNEGPLRHSGSQVPELYLFLINGSEGFVLVSGDDAAIPIPGYSLTEGIDTTLALPPNLKQWMEGYREQIRLIRRQNLTPLPEIRALWRGEYGDLRSAREPVEPMLTARWDQMDYYNEACPFDEEYNSRSLVGCVAVAVGQVMRYWEYPVRGVGMHSYEHPKYGLLKADFGAKNYLWNQMPDNLTSPNSEVATLLYHLGVSVNMSYATAEEGGSGAQIASEVHTIDHPDILVALTAYFGYSSMAKRASRSQYTDTDWQTMMREEMEAGRPVIYGGGGDDYGHAFVCDGFNGEGYFHMNWGWSGIYNGYFLLDALNPLIDFPFNTRHQAIVSLCPADPHNDPFPVLSSFSETSPVSYNYNFTLSATLKNEGEKALEGDLGVAMFNADYSLVDIAGMKSGQRLEPDAQKTLSFAVEPLAAMIPGFYRTFLAWRPEGADWRIISAGTDASHEADFGTIEVTNENTIALSMPILPRRQPPLADSTLSVGLNVRNLSQEAFKGLLSLSVYTREGIFIATVEEKQGLSLPAQSTFPDTLYFTNSHIPLEPGSYLLKLSHKRNGSVWELTGSSHLGTNPAMIRIVEQPPVSDRYETNDILPEATNLPVEFVSNRAGASTPGSNFHIASDIDNYRVELEPGYEYRVKTTLHDIVYNTSGKIFSADGCFVYSTDGINWSEIIDDKPSDERLFPEGTPLYIQAMPVSERGIGSYRLDIDIVRRRTLPAEPADDSKITVFPNPFTDYVTLSSPDDITEYKIFSPEGELLTTDRPGTSRVLIDLPDKGYRFYILKFTSQSKHYTRKLLCR